MYLLHLFFVLFLLFFFHNFHDTLFRIEGISEITALIGIFIKRNTTKSNDDNFIYFIFIFILLDIIWFYYLHIIIFCIFFWFLHIIFNFYIVIYFIILQSHNVVSIFIFFYILRFDYIKYLKECSLMKKMIDTF